MGTEIHRKNSFPGDYSMRNFNEDSNSSSWQNFYGDNVLTSSHYHDGFTPRTMADEYPGHEKDELKEKMIQHEVIFKNQVYELHRLYRRQRDMMEEAKRKESQKYQFSIDTSSSSSLMPSQKPYEGAQKWEVPRVPLGNSTSARPSIFGVEISNSPSSCSKGNGSKDCEVVECRPSKVRKKLFDLELPADEHVEPEEGERVIDNLASEISSYPTIETCFLTKNGVKTFLDDGRKKHGYKDTASGQRFTGLADLNEPAYIQEASVDFFGQSAKPMAVNHLPLEGEVSGRDRLSSCLREPGNGRSNMNYASQRFEPSKLQPSLDTMRRLHGKEVHCRGTYMESSSQMNQTPLLYGSSSGYPFLNTSDMGNSLPSHSYSSWGKSNINLTRKLTTFQTNPSFLSSPRSHEVFGEKWHRNGFHGKNTGFRGDIHACNRFFQGSSSGSKELPARFPLVGFDYRNFNKIDDGSPKITKGSNFVDLTGTPKGMDLNTAQTLSNEDSDSRKCDQTILPWLRAKSTICKNESSSNGLFKNGDMPKEKDNSAGRVFVCENVCTSASVEHRGIDINVASDDAFDSELENCNEKREGETDGEVKNFFDLNSCVTEDEDLLVSESDKSSNKKMTLEIDLEAVAVSEIEEHSSPDPKPDHRESEELLKIAAEAIIAVSGHPGLKSWAADDDGNKDEPDPLLWFIKVMERNLREIDEYEMLTLGLEETKEETYMAAQLVPDIQEPDEVGPTLMGRPRRGQSRRGRPRRDFQKDILPDMISLSRHEITEDLQIFGGLMRATGHSWNLGSGRKNGKKVGGRGRRKVKAVETTASPPLLEIVGLDGRKLTGWGKTTRRPRRQRCAVGNSVAVHIT